jgi:Uma2 family endonuclease
MRIKVQDSGLYTYPDISVVCGEPKLADEHFDMLLNPILLIEVLSPSTEAYDRGQKFQHYRLLDSLQDYVLIAQDQPLIEVFSRQNDGESWSLRDGAGLESSIDLPSISIALALAEVYEKVSFEDETPA